MNGTIYTPSLYKLLLSPSEMQRNASRSELIYAAVFGGGDGAVKKGNAVTENLKTTKKTQ